MSPHDLQLISVIAFSIVICMAFFGMGVIVGITSKRDKLPELKTPKIVEDAATALEKRIEELRNAPIRMKFNPNYKGIYTKERV